MNLLRLFVAVNFACLIAASARAQLAPVTTFDSLEWKTADSDLVVRGHVTSVERNEHETVAFHVDETIKGPPQKEMRFRVVTYSPTPKHDAWDSRAPMLLFMVESRRIGAVGMAWGDRRFISQYRFTPRWGNGSSSDIVAGSRIELVSGVKPAPFAASGKRIDDPDAILSMVRAAATRDGPFLATKIDIPNGLHVVVPKPGPPVANWGDSPPARFTSDAEYDGARVLAATGTSASLWDIRTGGLIKRFEGSGGQVQAVAISPEGNRVVIGAGPLPPAWIGEVLQWDIETGKADAHFGRPRAAVTRVDYVTGQYGLLTTTNTYGSTGLIQTLWNAFSEEPEFVFPGSGLAISPDKTMAASTNDNWGPISWAAVWDVQSHLQLCTLGGEPTNSRLFHSIAFRLYGNQVVTSADSGVEVWDAETGKNLQVISKARAWNAIYTQDGASILASTPNATIDMWDAESAKLQRQFKCPARANQFILSPNGAWLLAKWGDASASLFELATGKEMLRLDGGAAGLIGFSPDSKTICAINRPQARDATIWDSKTGHVLATVHLK